MMTTQFSSKTDLDHFAMAANSAVLFKKLSCCIFHLNTRCCKEFEQNYFKVIFTVMLARLIVHLNEFVRFLSNLGKYSHS